MIFLLPILLGTLLQECQGLQEGFQYQYQYTGTISTWIPNDPTQSSGSALRANVALQLAQSGDIIVKTSNIEVGEHNGKDACEAYKHVEFPYREMDPQNAALLETPFLVHVNKTEFSYLEVPQEPVWVTNIRRGIINTIPLIPLMGQHPPTLTFKLKEDTIMGTCYNWYNMLKLPNHLAKLENWKQEEIIEVDVQRERAASYSASGSKGRKTSAKGRKGSSKTTKTSKTHRRPAAEYSATSIEDTLSKLTRTLDIDQCKDTHFIRKINGNEESEERTQRSSEGTFLIRGEGTVLRLEHAEVQGDIVVYTGESDKEFIRTSSKQILQLRTVTRMEEALSITYVPLRRTLSFSIEDGPGSITNEKLLQIPPDNQQMQANMAGIVADLSKLTPADDAPGTERPHFLETFQRLVERMTISSWTEIEDLITSTANTEREKQIIYQAFLASGRQEVLVAFLNKMKEHSFRESNPLLVFQVLEAPTTPIRNPSLIPAMLEVVSNMNEDEEVSKAASLLNIAKLANRYCLDSQTANVCEGGCDNDFILNTFLPMLSRGLQDQHKWKKLLNVQAICALGSPYSVAFLQPIIEGTNDEDIDVRTNAIFCLTSDHLPKTAVDMAFDTLAPLTSNPTEFPEVRSAAYLVLTTWEPHLSWWQHMAISTWKETSAQVASFVSSTLISLSRGSDPQSENAKKVVHLAKHPKGSEAASLSRSMYLYLDEVVKNCKVGSTVKLAWLTSTKSAFPKSVYYQLQFITAMGMTQKEKAIYLTNAGKSLYQYYHSLTHSTKKPDDYMTFREIYEELKEDLELPITDITEETFFNFLLISEPIPVILSGEEPPHLKQNVLTLIYKTAAQKVPVHFRLVDSTLVMTSDLGLPVLVKHEEDFAFAVGADYTLQELIHYTVRLSLNVSHRNALKINTLVPWSNGFAAGAGVEASLDVTVPLTMIDLQLRRDNTATVILELLTQEQVKVLSRSNVMYTSLTPLYQIADSVLTPEESDSSNLGRKVVRNREMHESRFPELISYVEVEWKGDFEQPRDFNLFNNMSVTQLKYNNFDYTILLDPEVLDSKKVTFIFHIDIKEREERFTEQVRGGEGQVKQGLDDYEMFSQVSQSSSSGFVDFEQTSGAEDVEVQGQHSHTFNTHLEKMQALMMPSMGGKLYTFTVTMEPENGPWKHEMAINMAVSRGSIDEQITTEIQKIHITLMSHPRSGVISDPTLVCVDMRMETPYMLPLVTNEILLETNFTSEFVMSLYDGDDCDGIPVFKIESTRYVTPTTAQNMHSTEERDTCDGDFPRHIYPLYNHVHFTLTTAEDLPRGIVRSLVRDMDAITVRYKENESPRLSNEITVDADLITERDVWNITVVGPEKTASFLMAENPLLTPLYSRDVSTDFEKVCHLTHQSVNTYDGLVHPFEPSSCWTTATIVPFSSITNNIHDTAVQVRFTDQWEVRLISPASALVLDVTRSQILVNEEPFSGHSEKFVVHRLQDSHIVGIGMVAVRVGDTVDIMASNFYHGEVMGICGNYDGEPINDMMGPSGCLYTDPALHTIAWSTPGVGCSRFSLRNKKRALAEYREDCDTIFFQPTGISQQNAMTNCTEWRYDERSDPTGLFCKSKVPTSACLPGCQPRNALAKHVKYSCRLSPSPEQGAVQDYLQCFSTVSPVLSFTGCFHP